MITLLCSQFEGDFRTDFCKILFEKQSAKLRTNLKKITNFKVFW